MKKLILTVLSAAVVSFCANATILVYDGFAKSAYGISANGSGTLSSYPGTYDSTMIGFKNQTWKMNGSQPKVIGKGLSFPSCFAAAGITTTGDWSIGPNSGGNNTANRDTSRELTMDVLKVSNGKLFLRVLMHINPAGITTMAASDTLIQANGANCNYYGIGLAPSTGTSYTLLNSSSGAFGFFFLKDSSSNVHIVFRAKSADGTAFQRTLCDVTDLTTGFAAQNAFIAFAEIDVNAGLNGEERIYAGAMKVNNYTAALAGEALAEEIGEVNFITDTVYPKSLVFDGCYQTTGVVLFDEFAVATTAAEVFVAADASNALKLEDTSLSFSEGEYGVMGTVSKADAVDSGALAQAPDGTMVKFSYGGVSKEDSFYQPLDLSQLTADKTYKIFAYAENSYNAKTNEVGTIYNGALSLAKVKDAYECQREQGEVTVSRASADPYSLTVNYSLSSSAVGASEGTTWEAPVPVVIEAGETSATLTLKPMVDMSVDEDITVSLALADGNYSKPSPSYVDLTLYNLVAPSGYNTWVAAADGKASVASNWSRGVPKSTDIILFDGNFSTANCEWDGGTGDGAPSMTVAGWIQRDGYSGMVMIDTVYSGDFECLTVDGDMDIGVGSVSQHTNTTANTDTYRLRLNVTGDLTVASGAKINVSACGPNNGINNASVAYAADMDNIGSTWGDPKLPTACGKAGTNKSNAGAGGAAYITVTGTTTINGSLLAEGVRTISPYSSGYNGWGCGGSIYLETGSFTGSGIVSVNTELYTKGDNSRGTPGRISIWSKNTASTFPVDNLRAWGDRQETDYNIGAGTVVVRNPGEANGTLYVRNNPGRNFSYNITIPKPTQTTSIPKGATWTFDAVVLGNYGVLTIPTNSVLVLPNGFTSVSCLNTGNAASTPRNWHCGIIVREGGTVNATPVNGKHEFKGGRWTFCPCSTYTLTGDVEVSGGANIGVPLISQGTANFISCNMKVVGDMEVKSDGLVSAEYGGIGGNGTYAGQGYVAFEDNPIGKGKANGTGHGGQKATFSGNNAYDSFFDPHLPGSAGGHADYRNMGAGVVNLEVTGTLKVDGRISGSVQTFSADNHAGGAGSLNIRAGSLTGSGKIVANTNPSFNDYAKASYGSYGGGRIAVRLTSPDAVFSDYWKTNILAKGYSKVGAVSAKVVLTSENQRYSSAGSVYLQNGDESEKGGTIVIRNDGAVENTAYTSIPAAAETDALSDFKNAKLLLADCGKVRLYDSFSVKRIDIETNSTVDFNGNTLTVSAAKTGSTRIPAGTYEIPANGAHATYTALVNASANAGQLIVRPVGLKLVIR